MIAPLGTKLIFDEVYPSGDVHLPTVIISGLFIVGITTSLLGVLRSYHLSITQVLLGRSMSLLFVNHVQHRHLLMTAAQALEAQ